MTLRAWRRLYWGRERQDKQALLCCLPNVSQSGEKTLHVFHIIWTGKLSCNISIGNFRVRASSAENEH